MDIILLKLSCTMKMKKLKKQNEGKFMSRKNSINTMKIKSKKCMISLVGVISVLL